MNPEPIKICLIAPKTYPLFNPEVQSHFGGANVDLYYLSTELARDPNFEASFIIADHGQPEEERRENVRLLKSLDLGGGQLTGAIRVWRALRRADADIYVLKTAGPGTPLVTLFCLLHRRLFAYRTASAHECDGTYLKKHYFLGKAFAWSLRKAKIVLVQNSNDKENLAQTIGVSATIIPNGHRLEASAGNKRDKILWVGRSVRVKRPELFIEFAEEIPDEKFVMICQRATDDQNYKALVARAKKVENLQFVERVPFNEVENYFQRAKLFVNTSDAEGFPNAFIQACKCSTPILSLNVNPDEFLDEYNCGVSCDGDWQTFVDKLKFMLAENRYVQLGQNARKYVEEHHDITKIAEQYKLIFKQLIDDN